MNGLCGRECSKYHLFQSSDFSFPVRFRLFFGLCNSSCHFNLFFLTCPATFLNLLHSQANEDVCCSLYTLNFPPSCIYSTLFPPCNSHVLHILILSIYLVHKYLLRPHYVPGMGLRAECND